MRSFAKILASAALGLCGLVVVGCRPPDVCALTAGSCLILTVKADGPFDLLRVSFLRNPDDGRERSFESGGVRGMPVTLPGVLRIVPPTNVSASQIAALSVQGLRERQVVADGRTDEKFSWADDSHAETTVYLTPRLIPPKPPQDLAAPADSASTDQAKSDL